jgi:hypothetical protein
MSDSAPAPVSSVASGRAHEPPERPEVDVDMSAVTLDAALDRVLDALSATRAAQ